MASSVEAGGAWTIQEDIALCQSWVNVSHCPVTGNEMKFSHMWSKIHGEFCQRLGSIRIEMVLSSIWRILNKELRKWKNALTKARENIRSSQNISDEVPWGPAVVLNETPLFDSPSTDSPLDSPMETESPLPRPLRPIGRKAAKAKRGSNSNNECVQFMEQIAKNTALRIEKDLKREEADIARQKAFAIQQQQAQEKDMEDREMKIMAMDTSHMSPETKAYWKLRRMDVMRRKLFHDDGPSNTDWLNDQNH
ncbi:unnamed protein product [Prunus armeniaca]